VSEDPPPRPLRVLVDTNVLVQNRWLERIILDAREGYIQPLWSPLIIAEANRYLTWRWLQKQGGDLSPAAKKRCSAAAGRWFSVVTAAFQVVADRPPYPPLWTAAPHDPWDIPLWAAALAGGARVIVTENMRDGPPPDADQVRRYNDVLFLHPASFLTLVDALADPRTARWDHLPAAGASTAGGELGVGPLDADVPDVFRRLVAELSEGGAARD